MSKPLLLEYNGHVRGIVRQGEDFGFPIFDLAAAPRRLSASDSSVPLIEMGVDGRRVKAVRSPAELLQIGPQEESWLGLTQRTLARVHAALLVAEDPQRRLDARKAATLMHQVSLVQHIIENGNLRRVLIADEVGLGKTIEAGLIIKRLTEERPTLRVLYLAPARLVGNVASEFREKLDLDARIWVAGSASDARIETDRLVVASIHKCVFGNNAQRVVEAGPWDILVIDECHHLSDWGLDGGKPNQSFKLVNQLAQSLPSDGRFILMSGTPHQGSETRFKNLLRLLSDDGNSIASATGRVIYRTKDAVRDWKGRPLFPSREVRPPRLVRLGADYERWYNSVGDLYDTSIIPGSRGRATGWAKGQALQWAASSVQAGLGFLVRLGMRRLNLDLGNDALARAIAALRPYRGGAADESLQDLYVRLRKQVGLIQDESAEDEEEDQDDDWKPIPEALETLLRDGVSLLNSPAATAKWDVLAALIDASEGEKIVLFAQPVETVSVVARFLESRYGVAPSIIIGNQSEDERRQQVDSFQREGGPRFLVSSRAGGEGLNMQKARRLIHLDVPWNPMEMEQRIGRIHRFGSRKTIVVDTVVAAESREVEMYRIARDKLHLIATQLDPEQFEILFSRVMSLVPPKELEDIMSDYRAGPAVAVRSDDIGKLVKDGYQAWQKFDGEYRSNAQKIQATAAGEATWIDVGNFLRRQGDAELGPDTNQTSFTYAENEIVAVDERLPTIRMNGQFFACGDSGGLLPDPINGQAVKQLGLNLPEVAATLRRAFMPDRACGAGYLKGPSGLDVIAGPAPFGLQCFVRQTIRYEQERAAEERLSLHCYIVREAGKEALSPSQQATLLRTLADATRIKDPVDSNLSKALVVSEAKIVDELRLPSEAEIASRVRHVVWPVATLMIM